MREDFRVLAQGLLPAVLEAGACLMDHFGNVGVPDTKSDGSPVTEADRQAEAILLKALTRVEPTIPVIAEEATAAGHIPDVDDRFFLVDPLDGTKEFLGGRKEFTVNVGLICSGVPRFGIIYAPALEKMYLTLCETCAIAATVPAHVQEITLEALETGAEVMKTRPVPSDQAMTIVASRSHGSKALEAWLEGINVKRRVNIGSSLKFCEIAQGTADIYPRFGPTMEWDTAAGHAIVLAAGGVVTLDDCSSRLYYAKHETDYKNPGFIVWAREENTWRVNKAR